MPTVAFTPNLERHLSVPASEVGGGTVGAALAEVFAANPRLRSYLVDDQGHLRQHVTVFVDGRAIADPQGLSDAVGEASEIFVMQALSGG